MAGPLLQRLCSWWRQRRSAPSGRPLPHSRLFVLPTRFGVGWALLTVVLLLFGINYQNNLAYGLAFWLFAVGVVGLIRTWRNLLGVEVRLQPPGEVFAGDTARLGVVVRAARPRAALQASLGGAVADTDLDDGEAWLWLDVPVSQRGRVALPPLRIATRWPLGLVSATAWVDASASLLAYPRPLDGAAGKGRPGGAGQEALDFAGLRRYQAGDSPAHLAWKQWSRSGTLQTKHFSAPPARTLWLDYAACQGDAETRLSLLCGQVLAHHAAGDAFGLRLPGVEVPIARGGTQRRRMLEVLALWSPTPVDDQRSAA